MVEPESPHQIVICCDGTHNNLTGRACDTNVVKLCELFALDEDPDRLLYYDPGIGNPGSLPAASPWDMLQRIAGRFAGLAFGRGVYRNIAATYIFLMRHYQPGSQIFIFGYSRGAFIARAVAGLVNEFGVLQPQMESMVPTLLQIYFSDRQSDQTRVKRIATQTRALFAGPATRRVDVHYIGVWDTVASVGMWPFATRFTERPEARGKRFLHIRQALALDEHRAQFRPRPYVDANGPLQTAAGTPGSIEQLWFRGAHNDVGGGCGVEDGALSDRPLCWLVSAAVQCGLRLRPRGITLDTEPAVARALLDVQPAPERPGVLHSGLWDSCGWALSGLAVRDTRVARLDDGSRHALDPHEHASVAERSPRFPAGTVWARPRAKGPLAACCVAFALLLLLLGHLLGEEAPERTALDLLQANVEFACWQLSAWWPGHLDSGLQFRSPRLALVCDLALIAVYAYLLSWWSVRAFAVRAGCRRAGQAVPHWLNALGRALPLAVCADLGEDLVSGIVLTLLNHGDDTVAWLASWPMAALATAKLVGLAGALVLIASGWLRRGATGQSAAPTNQLA